MSSCSHFSRCRSSKVARARCYLKVHVIMSLLAHVAAGRLAVACCDQRVVPRYAPKLSEKGIGEGKEVRVECRQLGGSRVEANVKRVSRAKGPSFILPPPRHRVFPGKRAELIAGPRAAGVG